jgi:hypothetical protein
VIGGNALREDITASWRGRESEGFIVATKPGNAGGAKGPCWKHVAVSGWVCHLEETPVMDLPLSTETITALSCQVGHPANACLQPRFPGKPDAGNPPVRFEEGRGFGPAYSTRIRQAATSHGRDDEITTQVVILRAVRSLAPRLARLKNATTAFL